MDTTDSTENQVIGFYNKTFKYEEERLSVHSPVEGGSTARQLKKYLKSGMKVLEVGVGVGVYSELIAK